MTPAAQFGFILENIGGGEIVVIAFLALVVLGPERIPEMARGAGRMLHNLRKLTSEWTGDMQEIVNDPAMQPIRELGEFAVRPRQKLAEYALEAEAEERSKAASSDDRAAAPGEGAATTEDRPGTSEPAGEPPPATEASDAARPASARGAEHPDGSHDAMPIDDAEAEAEAEPATRIADEDR